MSSTLLAEMRSYIYEAIFKCLLPRIQKIDSIKNIIVDFFDKFKETLC